ncbi:MAG: Sorbitol dehydrogenase [Candidatus Hydrogenedentes bacterium ADurb.Bin101]|nr:MAG: Sorbitol dehydrogenase [Candidatus Hydrogenedentes bacterium ADurb.Bin101]HOC69538.1 alcohol dehydrogenase catalytic domain-containing protein [Candidatus Hydrogenedentota bacterium]
MSKFNEFKQAIKSLPERYKAWQVFGAGLENVGKDEKPVSVPLHTPNHNEVLLRVDALGLCLSDMKIIAQGGNHPRLRGRDLQKDPTVLGHECAATIVAVGDDWKDKFSPGQRFIVQADIYYKGLGYAFGYLIPGGLAEYSYMDERGLDGDEGCYLLPVRETTGYSESALSEPWACVEMSYALEDRVEPTGEKQLIVSNDCTACKERFPNATFVSPTLEGLPEGTFDDIIIAHPTPALVETLGERLNPNGVLFLVGAPAETGDAMIDVGAVHYQNKRYLGGGDTLESIAQANRRQDLRPGGTGLFIGAGGPMGQMHVQRAIEKQNGLGRVVVTDLDRKRLNHIEDRFGALARTRNVELITLAPTDFDSQDAMNARIKELAGADGYSDVVVLAPVPALVRQGVSLAGANGFVNLFAGLATGTKAPVPVEQLCRGVKMIGCSGSRIRDLRAVLAMVEARELESNRSVAAIGGLDAAHDGLKAVKEAVYPGKIIIYTQVPSFPLTPLDALDSIAPDIAAKLTEDGSWCNAAEEAFLEKYLP